MADLHDVRDLEDFYGLLYPYSDHKRGERITYCDQDSNQIGTILWVCGPGPVSQGGPLLGMHYIVENDNAGWPDTVFPNDVIMVAEKTPTVNHDIKCSDTVEYQGMHHVHLFGKAVHNLLPWQKEVKVELINTPGMIVSVPLSDVIAVHRATPGEKTIIQSWE